MSERHRPEPTQAGNPHKLTRQQHIHAAACIKRFGDSEGQVRVRLKSGHTFPADPRNKVFTIERVWSQKLERGLFKQVEDRFQDQARAVLAGSCPEPKAIREYLAIWKVRADLSMSPPTETKLNLGSEPRKRILTKDQEERLEALGVAYMRGDTMPGRLASQLEVMQRFDMLTLSAEHFGWRTLRSTGAHFISADTPGNQLFIAISPTIALWGVAGAASGQTIEVPDETVEELNRRSLGCSNRLVFGHPDDL